MKEMLDQKFTKAKKDRGEKSNIDGDNKSSIKVNTIDQKSVISQEQAPKRKPPVKGGKKMLFD
jgi:hypothetical protein